MNKKISVFGLVFLSAALVTASASRADQIYYRSSDDVGFGQSGIVLGADANQNSMSGDSVGTSAGLHVRFLHESDLHDTCPDCYSGGMKGFPNANLEVDARWNVMDQNLTSGQAATGVSFRAQGGVAAQLRDLGAEGCDVFVAAHGLVDGETFTSDRAGSKKINASIGPETGLECKAGKALLQFSPSVEFGVMDGFNGRVLRTGLDAALHARFAYGDKFYASAQGAVGPKGWQVGDKTEKASASEIDFTTDYRLTDTWAVGADVKYIRMNAEDPSEGTSFKGRDLTVGARAVRVF